MGSSKNLDVTIHVRVDAELAKAIKNAGIKNVSEFTRQLLAEHLAKEGKRKRQGGEGQDFRSDFRHALEREIEGPQPRDAQGMLVREVLVALARILKEV